MARNTGSRPESPRPPSTEASRTATPLPNLQENKAVDQSSVQTPVAAAEEGTKPDEAEQEGAPNIHVPDTLTDEATAEDGDNKSMEGKLPKQVSLTASACPDGSARTSTDSEDPVPELDATQPRSTFPPSQGELEAQRHSANEASAESMQEEIDGYIERIDALQAKLLYVTKEVSKSARESALAAEKGTFERKLAEKDEKIALLLEEGQTLSKTEMKHLTTIKRVRRQLTTAAKEQVEERIRAQKTEKELVSTLERARKAELAAKRAEENLTKSVDGSRDLETLTKERQALTATIADMKEQVLRANLRADQAEAKAQSSSLEKEKKRSDQLHEELTTARIERELGEDKLSREIKDLQAALEREKEHFRVMETEMLGEQAVLESKLESFRARAEEASSSDTGNTHAKLLRQIETLQAQYSSASQNWQGIEASLLTRMSGLEKERDEVVFREIEVRKKLRDVTLKSKQKDREVEDISTRISDSDRRFSEAQDEIQKAQRRVQELSDDCAQAKQDLHEQRISAEKDFSRRLEEEKSKWTAMNSISRMGSPNLADRKPSGLDTGQYMNPATMERPRSRRSSTIHGLGFDSPRQASMNSGKGLSNGNTAETPSIITSMDDDFFANVPPTPASQTHTPSHRGVNDILSTSTVGAGPSVQLVERMSANVRRLESEKAASRDELRRLTTQRDDSRQQLVQMMKEVEQKRAVDERLKTLEAEHAAFNKRYQTTLEMLGEKSEMVEELKADVADMKQMYRELADTMGK